jgi:NifU-like protein involved in Fe-S cluster formation
MNAVERALADPLIESDYNANVARLFKNTRHAGTLVATKDVVNGQAGTRAQGASVRFWLCFQGERVQTARFQAYGCPHFIAAAENLCSWAEGRARVELQAWNWRESAAYLAVPPSKRARLLVLEDALHRAAGVAGQNR